MHRSRFHPRTLLVSVLAVTGASLLLAACGSSSDSETTSAATTATREAAGQPGTVPACFPNCENARLSKANMRATKLDNGNFRSANLKFTTFTDASLRGADLNRADVTNAYFAGADLTGATISNLRDANISSKTICPSGNSPKKRTASDGTTELRCN
jgi:hypothetical protein